MLSWLLSRKPPSEGLLDSMHSWCFANSASALPCRPWQSLTHISDVVEPCTPQATQQH